MAEKKANRLLNSSSPYLLQHAHNPVEWYPWGNEALEEARKLDKPIIVSIGYSSCHWCHVMERESFENDSIAEIMNAHFINIKVDREERPDIDQVYMEAVHAMGLQGGWPLNVFLTPDQKPFYGGTYFPPNGWGKLLMSVARAYKENRDKLEESAEKFTEVLNKSEIKRFGLQSSTELNENFLKDGYSTLSQQFDHQNGGFNRAPKFPMPSIYQFLIRYYHVTKDEGILNHIQLTLNKMGQGGIYDQAGGGFARYSVDELWHAPHFEKMLYDNGQLLSLYAEAYKINHDPAYLNIINETISWLKREMLSTQGGFYSALDADSEGVEGKYYVWKKAEIDSILGEDADLFNEYFSVTESGNWENGENILHAIASVQDFAKAKKLDPKEFDSFLNSCKNKLLEVRKTRIAPGLDDKIITGWNSLALKGLVDAYVVTEEVEYLNLAIRNAEFIEKYMYSSKSGKLMRNWQSSHPEYQVSGVLEDYATLIEALLSLYQSTFNEKWLEWSKKLLIYSLENFFDEKEYMFFYKSKNDEALIARKKELFDNVIPSSNSIMARNLHLLGIIYDNPRWIELSQKMVSTISSFFEKALSDTSNWATAYSELLYPFPEIAIVGENANLFGNEIMKKYYSGKVLLGTTSSSELPLLLNRTDNNIDTTIFVCFNKACRLPVKSVADAMEQLP